MTASAIFGRIRRTPAAAANHAAAPLPSARNAASSAEVARGTRSPW